MGVFVTIYLQAKGSGRTQEAQVLEILQFYVSGFWVWLGITIGISFIGAAFAGVAGSIAKIFKSDNNVY
jgi:ABC-type multidrug transport system permease subunit